MSFFFFYNLFDCLLRVIGCWYRSRFVIVTNSLRSLWCVCPVFGRKHCINCYKKKEGVINPRIAWLGRIF